MNPTAPHEVERLQVILKVGYGLVPIIAGADKFTNLLTDWSAYVPSGMAGLLPLTPAAFMMVVGVIEVAAGILVLTRTRLGAEVVWAWLTAIALVLVIGGGHFDVAVRDLVMALGAYVLARLTAVTEEGHAPAAAHAQDRALRTSAEADIGKTIHPMN